MTDIDQPRGKRCDGESISLSQGMTLLQRGSRRTAVGCNAFNPGPADTCERSTHYIMLVNTVFNADRVSISQKLENLVFLLFYYEFLTIHCIFDQTLLPFSYIRIIVYRNNSINRSMLS